LPAVTGPDLPIRRVLTLALATVLLAGCGSSSSSKTASTPATSASSAATTPQTTTSATTARPGCQAATAPQPRGPQHLAAPTQRLAPARTYVVTLSTNCGSIEIQLDVKRAPKTSASFASLVKRRFYDGLSFHRIAAGFVIQGGDPSGDGSGGPGYTIVEKPPANLNYTPGTVAMAKSATQPDGASGSQFFIVTGTASALPPQYALVGRVVGGMAAVNAIAAIPSNPPQDGAPTRPVVIRRAVLSTR
jgi:cyclophilin family peptidyl-prolyl cis-trans isomerase